MRPKNPVESGSIRIGHRKIKGGSMKKALVFLLVVSMLLTMSACTKKDSSGSENSKAEKNKSADSVSADNLIIGGADSKTHMIVSNDNKDPLGRVPVVTYEDKKIYINGEYFAASEKFAVYRIDEYAISFATDEGLVNLTADGEEIKLSCPLRSQ